MAACHVINDIWRVVRQWPIYFDEMGVPKAEQDKIAPAIRHLHDIATPELRRLLLEDDVAKPDLRKLLL